MSIALSHVGRTVSEKQFGPDSFVEHYKCENDDGTIATADQVLADLSGFVPLRGQPHPDYPTMFVTDRQCQETGDRASALDVVYQGFLHGLSDYLPPAQNGFDRSISTANSRRGSGLVLAQPCTVEYYAPTTERSWVTYGVRGVETDIPDPTDDVNVVTYTVDDASFSPGNLTTLLATLFTTLISSKIRSTEIVAGSKFWINQGTKSKHLVPYIFSPPAPGFFPILYSPGSGYLLNETIYFNFPGHGSATGRITSIGVSNSILTFDILSNSINAATVTPYPITTSGPGTGAQFIVISIP